jgi:hypothetical protein
MVLALLHWAHHMAEGMHLIVVEGMEVVGKALVLLHQVRRMAEDMHSVVVEGMEIVGMALVLVLLRHMAESIHMVAEGGMEVAEEELHMIVGFEDMGCAMVEVGDIVDMVEANLLDYQ